MKKLNHSLDKDDIRFLFKKLYDKGIINKPEYTKAMEKLLSDVAHVPNINMPRDI